MSMKQTAATGAGAPAPGNTTAVPDQKTAEATVIGIIGTGNMGGAIAESLCGHPLLRETYQVRVFDCDTARARALQALGAIVDDSAAAVAKAADLLIPAVKPDVLPALLQELVPELSSTTPLLSIAAGVTLEQLHRYSQGRCPLTRIMPNTLVRAGYGIFGIAFPTGAYATDKTGAYTPSADQKGRILALFQALGQVVEIDESKMNAFTALSGSGPAFVFHFMESLAEAGVRVGLSRADSLHIAQTLLAGSAALTARTGDHPAVLREQVTSPGGTTAAGVNHMDRCALRGHMVDAVYAAYLRGKEMEG